MEIDEKPKKKLIKQKVVTEESYLDEEGFECTREVVTWVEKEVEVSVSSLKKSKPTQKTGINYKAPAKGQSSLNSFFGRS